MLLDSVANAKTWRIGIATPPARRSSRRLRNSAAVSVLVKGSAPRCFETHLGGDRLLA